MLLAFSTNAFKKFSLFDALRSIAKIGYDGVEIMCDVPHAFPEAIGPKDITKVNQMLDDLEIRISNLNAFTMFAIGDTYHPSWIEDDQMQACRRLMHTKNCVRLARQIGADNLSTEPG